MIEPGEPADFESTTAHAFSLKHLGFLFVQPSRYFQAANLKSNVAYIIAVYLIGISGVMGRIDTQMLQSDPGSGGGIIRFTDNWIYYWVAVMVAGLVSGAVSWLILGWWYGYRARLCGYDPADTRTPRVVWAFSNLVETLPAIILTIAYTLHFDSYTVAFYSDDFWSVLLVIFPFWSCYVSYIGAQRVMGLAGRKLLVWFLILPILFYVMIFGFFGVLGYLFL